MLTSTFGEPFAYTSLVQPLCPCGRRRFPIGFASRVFIMGVITRRSFTALARVLELVANSFLISGRVFATMGSTGGGRPAFAFVSLDRPLPLSRPLLLPLPDPLAEDLPDDLDPDVARGDLVFPEAREPRVALEPREGDLGADAAGICFGPLRRFSA